MSYEDFVFGDESSNEAGGNINEPTNEWWYIGEPLEDLQDGAGIDEIRGLNYNLLEMDEANDWRVVDEKPPFYPFNTFALRDNNCESCHEKIFAPGWFFRFRHMQTFSFRCEDCFTRSNSFWMNGTKHGRLGLAIYNERIVPVLGLELVKMLEGAALSN